MVRNACHPRLENAVTAVNAGNFLERLAIAARQVAGQGGLRHGGERQANGEMSRRVLIEGPPRSCDACDRMVRRGQANGLPNDGEPMTDVEIGQHQGGGALSACRRDAWNGLPELGGRHPDAGLERPLNGPIEP